MLAFEEKLSDYLRIRRDIPTLIEESFLRFPYNVVVLGQRYYAIHQNEGEFHASSIEQGNVKYPAFVAESLAELHERFGADTLSRSAGQVFDGWDEPEALRAKARGLLGHAAALEELLRWLCRFVPPGHYYSPNPSAEDIERHRGTLATPPAPSIPGIALREPVQLAHLEAMADEYASLPVFPQTRVAGSRYYWDNPELAYFDAIALRYFMRKTRPARVVEVGSGHSSSLMLDVNDNDLGGAASFTFIDPNPERLLSVIGEEDRRRVTILKERVQDVDLAIFDALDRGDILYIDSSHITKLASDVNFLFFTVLPRLKPGVWVHVHDIGYPFEYPIDFIEQGRAWNEAYLLRAFLMYNQAFEIEFWAAHATHFQPEMLQARMPLCWTLPGGSFWMRKLG